VSSGKIWVVILQFTVCQIGGPTNNHQCVERGTSEKTSLVQRDRIVFSGILFLRMFPSLVSRSVHRPSHRAFRNLRTKSSSHRSVKPVTTRNHDFGNSFGKLSASTRRFISPTAKFKLSRIQQRTLQLSRQLSTISRSNSSGMSSYSQEQSVAISAVLKASLVARKVQDQLIGSGGVQKKDKSPVTGELRGNDAISFPLLFPG